jgi:RNA polymerase sigma-70 factor (ECF subfamily)
MNAMFDSAALSAQFDSYTDEELLFECRTFGRVNCFDEIVRRYSGPLARYLRGRYSLSADQVEDALQATFLRVWEKIDQFDVKRRLRPWIYRIATSQTVDLFRRANPHNACVSLDAPRDEDSSSWANEIEGVDPGPSEVVERRDLASKVRSLADSLPERYREVIDMVFYQGMTYRKTALTLHLGVDAVVRRRRKAIEIMGSSLFSERLDASRYSRRSFVGDCESV